MPWNVGTTDTGRITIDCPSDISIEEAKAVRQRLGHMIQLLTPKTETAAFTVAWKRDAPEGMVNASQMKAHQPEQIHVDTVIAKPEPQREKYKKIPPPTPEDAALWDDTLAKYEGQGRIAKSVRELHGAGFSVERIMQASGQYRSNVEAYLKVKDDAPEDRVKKTAAIKAEFDKALAEHGTRANTIRALHKEGWSVPKLVTGSAWATKVVERLLATKRPEKRPRATSPKVATPAIPTKPMPAPAKAPPAAKEAAPQGNLPFVPAAPRHRPLEAIERDITDLMDRMNWIIPRPEKFEGVVRDRAEKGYGPLQPLCLEWVQAVEALRPSKGSSPSVLLSAEQAKRQAYIDRFHTRPDACRHMVHVEKIPRPEVMSFWGIGAPTLAEYLGEPSTGLSYVSKSKSTSAGNGKIDPAKLFNGAAREAPRK